jgi:hypothetical protein
MLLEGVMITGNRDAAADPSTPQIAIKPRFASLRMTAGWEHHKS